MVQLNADTAYRYEMAAAQGAAAALFQLGLMYSTGHGVAEDYVLAHKWFNLAALRGISDAREFRGQIAGDMTQAKIAEAQRLAREWMQATGALAH
jgi:TPR repeat protein